jgi:hypothetical protein
MRRQLVLIYFLVLSFFSKAQVSMEDFLGDALNEPGIQTTIKQNAFLNTKAYRMAPIQQLQFRTESNQLDPDRQEYALRLNPANPWEMKRNNQYFKSYQELIALDRDRLLKESLLNRYEAIISWLYYQQLKQLKEEDKKLTEKMLGILEGQRFSGYFEPDEYVDLKLDQVDKEIELENILFEIDKQRKQAEILHQPAKTLSIEWNETQVISIDKLELKVDSLLIQKANGGEVAFLEKKIDLANSEWQLEKNNINVGYVQAQYQPFREEQGRKPWNIALGVTIPVFNPNKGDMAKRKMDVIEAQGELDEAKVEQEAKRELAYHKIKSQISRYRNINTMMQELDAGKLAGTLQQMSDNNPAVTIRLQSKLVKLKIMAARLKQEIYLSYIEFLGYSEVLQQLPLVNYLSPQLRLLNSK